MDSHEKQEASNLYVNLKDHFGMLLDKSLENIRTLFQANAERLAETAKVLEHRLEVLNHAHEQSIEDRTDFLRQSEYNAKMISMDQWKSDANNKLTILTATVNNIEARMGGLNELRKEVISDRAQFVKKDTYDIKTTNYDDWCTSVNERLTKIETRLVTWVGALGLFFLVVEFFMRYFWK